MTPIDVHVLRMSTDRTDWVDGLKQDLEREQVHVRHRHAIMGDTGLARATAFRLAEQPYVSFVDPDDRVAPGTYDKLLSVLENQPDVVMVSSGEVVMDANLEHKLAHRAHAYDASLHRESAKHVHGVLLMRREAVLRECWRMEGLARCSEWALTLGLANQGRVVCLPDIGRVWRQHRRQWHRRCTEEQFQRAKARGLSLAPWL